MKRLLVLVALAAASCSGIEKITAPDGRTGFLVICERNFESFGSCREKALKVCNGGKYEEISRTKTSMEVVCVS